MSTGLTYVSIVDNALSANPQVGSSYVFASYDEAVEFGDWYCRCTLSIYGAGTPLTVLIYTTGPNRSGYYVSDAVPLVFVAFE